MTDLFRVSLIDMKTGQKLFWTGDSISEIPEDAWTGAKDAAQQEAKTAMQHGIAVYEYQYKVSVEAVGQNDDSDIRAKL